MKSRQIIAGAIDMCGASMVAKLPDDQATLYFLNALADYDLELASSSKGQRLHSFTHVLAAGTREGTFSDTTITLRPEFVRYQNNQISNPSVGFQNWTILDVVDDISDLTDAENRGRRVILFESVKPIKYRLSFVPQEAISAIIFGKKLGTAITTLDAEPTDFPNEFAGLLTVEVALFLLGDLLLLEGSEKYFPFVKTRMTQLEERKRNLRHRWDVYRSNADDANSHTVSRGYDVSLDYGDVLDDGLFDY